MRKMKKINGYLVVKFNARELREYEGTALGEYGVIDAELYTGSLDIDRGVMEYDGAETLDEAVVVWCRGDVPVMVDPKGALIPQVRPAVVVDAILAKKNLGTTRDMAPLTIALGPGFTAGEDVDFVVETKRGHRLGRIIREGIAVPNTGVPGVIGGYSAERVVRAAREGIFHELRAIGDVVESGDVIAEIEAFDGTRTPVTTCIGGILRGLLRDGYPVTMGFKVADVDPRREELENCFLISDKARCIAGSVLELVAEQLWK